MNSLKRQPPTTTDNTPIKDYLTYKPSHHKPLLTHRSGNSCCHSIRLCVVVYCIKLLYNSHESGLGKIRIQPWRLWYSSLARRTNLISSPVSPVLRIEGPPVDPGLLPLRPLALAEFGRFCAEVENWYLSIEKKLIENRYKVVKICKRWNYVISQTIKICAEPAELGRFCDEDKRWCEIGDYF